jgi:small redox-active disulfide protein 2
MKIEVLGPGCPKCKKLAEVVEAVVAETGRKAQVVKVTDIQQIVDSGVMSTPGLRINGKLMSSGRLPNREEIANWLAEAGE